MKKERRRPIAATGLRSLAKLGWEEISVRKVRRRFRKALPRTAVGVRFKPDAKAA
jgi:hypothetical protein